MFLTDPDSCDGIGVGAYLREDAAGSFLQRDSTMARIACLLAGEDANLSRSNDHSQRVRQALAIVFHQVRKTVQGKGRALAVTRYVGAQIFYLQNHYPVGQALQTCTIRKSL